MYLVDLLILLMLIRLPVLILTQGELKPTFLISLVALSLTKPNKLNNFLFQCHLYFCINPVQFDMNIAKINFSMTYVLGVAQNWF